MAAAPKESLAIAVSAASKAFVMEEVNSVLFLYCWRVE